jgi:hypothetical protein
VDAVSSVEIDDLLHAGLLEPKPEPHLSPKGRDWLRVLEGLQTDEVTLAGSSDEDFVQSTSALFR